MRRAGGTSRALILRCLVATAVFFALLGCGSGEEPAAPAPRGFSTRPAGGHARMVGLLADLAARTDTEHPLLGDGPMIEARRRLAALPADAPDRQRLPLLGELGELELRQGRLEAGIEHLAERHRRFERLYAAGRVRVDAVFETAFRLGVAEMRLGETQNCCLRRAPESCIVPLRGSGIHTRQEGSREAIRRFEEVLRLAPRDSPVSLKARWLLNIAYMTIDGYPDEVPESYRLPPRIFRSPEPFPRFPNRAPQLGLDVFDLAGGAIVDDFDGDGYLDILVSTYDPTQHLRFFRNERDGTFSDRSAEAHLDGLLGGFNLVQADYDNDGDPDVLVLRGAWLGRAGQVPNSLLSNNGDGTFVDVTFEAGLGEVHYPTQTANWADYDNDGDLDLYVGNESVLDLFPPCQLFRNNGDGTFTDVATEAGVTNFAFAKSVAWGDYDADGDPDLYVSNLGQDNRLYRNNGDGTFTDVADELGVAGPSMSFASWFWDYDNDGNLDLYSASYHWSDGTLAAVVRSELGLPVEYSAAALYRGDGQGGFRDVAAEVGLTRLALPMGANFGDLDNDGYLDFYLGTGYPDYEALTPNLMFRNDGGARFVDVTFAGGFGHLQKGHGVAFADLDNDGDQDVFEQIGGFYLGDRFANALFENPGSGNHWLTVALEGRRSNRSAIGARLRVDVRERGRTRTVYRHVNSGGSFGAGPLRQTVGLGRAEAIERLEVFWPTTGSTQTFSDLPLDGAVRIVEGEKRYEVLRLDPIRLGGPGAAGESEGPPTAGR